MKRSIELNSLTSLAITKLDVMDELEEIKICTGYRLKDEILEVPPIDSDAFEGCEPIYETLPGWRSQTVGIKSYDALPVNAKAYLQKLSEVLNVPLSLISTGPDREETIEVKPLFEEKILEKIA